MPGHLIAIPSAEGGTFNAYLTLPNTKTPTAAVVLCSSIHGIDIDHQVIADRFAQNGFIGVAPDLFWRTLPGPLHRADQRSRERSAPRAEKIRTGEGDLVDTLRYLGSLDRFNSKAAAMGFCYGGPYALIAPKRLGYAAGISCHGSAMGDYTQELDGITQPVAIFVGDDDHTSPPDVLAAYDAAARRMPNLEHHILPGVQHGFMLRGSASFSPEHYEPTLLRSMELLAGLTS